MFLQLDRSVLGAVFATYLQYLELFRAIPCSQFTSIGTSIGYMAFRGRSEEVANFFNYPLVLNPMSAQWVNPMESAVLDSGKLRSLAC